MTQDRNNEIYLKRLNGSTYSSLAKEYNISNSRVVQIFTNINRRKTLELLKIKKAENARNELQKEIKEWESRK